MNKKQLLSVFPDIIFGIFCTNNNVTEAFQLNCISARDALTVHDLLNDVFVDKKKTAKKDFKILFT